MATLARADDGIRLDKNMYIDTKYVIKGTFERACVIVFCGAQSNKNCCFFSINSRKTRFYLLSSRLAVLKMKTLTQKRMLGNLN